MSSLLQGFDLSLEKTFMALVAVGVLAAFDLTRRFRDRRGAHYFFGCILGTLLSVAFLTGVPYLFSAEVSKNPYAVAMGIVMLVCMWRLLFGPWETHVKATVLGMFLFWITMHILDDKTPDDRMIVIVSMFFALLPAALWAWLFLPYHSEKPSRIALMFFAGMSATAPILFYDALVKKGGELHFFYFRVVPESFNAASQSFVRGELHGAAPLTITLSVVFMSFLFVALIEEGAKYWVLRRSGEKFFTSIDDVLELSIVVALGFAFAENILNSSYFPTFVRQYLIRSETRDIMAFLGNVAGRSILTSMVHIVSTGIIGISLGRAIFARSILKDDVSLEPHRTRRFSRLVGRVLNIDPVYVFRTITLGFGLTCGVMAHAIANFVVTLPEVLPGNPRTLGDLLGSPASSFFHGISLIVFPSLFYVVGGFLLITWLLEWRSNRAERGRKMNEEVFVTA